MFRRIYFDHSATTPVDQRVVEAMVPYLTETFGNASSIHHYGQQARGAVDKARHQVAALINARPNEIVFTSGGTESNNLAIRGLIEARAAADGGKPHIVTTNIEHPAVKNVCQDLEKLGYGVTYVAVPESGVVDPEAVLEAVTDETALISVMAANNEIGTLQPIAELGRFVRGARGEGRKLYLHTDAVQAAGKIAVDVEEMGCDLLSLSGHKFYAPKGIGALYVRRGTRLHPQNLGGRQERGIRGGTEPVAQIVAIGEAARIAVDEIGDGERIRDLRNKLESNIFEMLDGAVLNGDPELRLPNISNISFKGIEGEGLLINLDMQGIAVSTGSACSSGSLEPSPVIRALGREDQLARGAIRFSLGRGNTEEDIDRLLEVLPEAVATLRRLSGRQASV